ncbi:hypothetical protein HXX76_014098 [Chlamydomonas incerta]|uniref:Uncharacterized protein n=1 Tax=Chlamydomonas incerta TaxID=51695 RepID=A0A835SQW5_CHLIN|nr:hypothetical protein HXX76_014098 [Chlamydomonas incerta]|eukprot:KAG2424940.1 hypothetical protein HXX76_014098 [Chlamydomonas incerta]
MPLTYDAKANLFSNGDSFIDWFIYEDPDTAFVDGKPLTEEHFSAVVTSIHSDTLMLNVRRFAEVYLPVNLPPSPFTVRQLLGTIYAFYTSPIRPEMLLKTMDTESPAPTDKRFSEVVKRMCAGEKPKWIDLMGDVLPIFESGQRRLSLLCSGRVCMESISNSGVIGLGS